MYDDTEISKKIQTIYELRREQEQLEKEIIQLLIKMISSQEICINGLLVRVRRVFCVDINLFSFIAESGQIYPCCSWRQIQGEKEGDENVPRIFE